MWTRSDVVPFMLNQVDIAVGRFGANAVRVMGSHVAADDLGMTTYNALWSEFIEGCAERGAYVYPCMGGMTAALVTSELEAQAASWGAVVNSHFNVIGIDVTNEWRGGAAAAGISAGDAWTLVQALAAALRAVTSKPLAISDFLNESVIAADYIWVEYASGVFDWIDLHVYYDTDAPASSDLDDLLASPWFADFPIVFGEYGIAASEGFAARIAYYEGTRDLQVAVGGLGSFSWAIKNDAFGLVNDAEIGQSDVTVPFQTFPKS